MESFWHGRAAAGFVLMTVVSNWCAGGAASGWVRFLAILGAFLVTVVLRHWRFLCNVLRTMPRDVRCIYYFIRTTLLVKKFERDNSTVTGILEERARTSPDKKCFLFEDEIWTFRDVNNYSNRVARAMQRAGVGPGDVVALMMGNCVEFMCIWLGLAKLGAVTSLINRNLRDVSLSHSINTAKSKVFLFGEDYADAVEGVRHELNTVEKFFQFGGKNLEDESGWFEDLVPLLDKETVDKPATTHVPQHRDHIMYIYTSGTTGLPKACIITHARVMFWPIGVMLVSDLRPDRDLHYCALPLYHAAAGAYCCSMALVHDVPVAITSKFSATKFWADCIKHNATSAQYIGELCRFLVLAPESPRDQQHNVRVLIGNGMSPAVWLRIQKRFGVQQITELYGSTEGNVMLVNIEAQVGAMGFMPLLVPRSLWHVDVVRVEETTYEPVRDDVTGLCIRCKEGEPGVMIGKINEEIVHRQFLGYLDRVATDKKVITDVFNHGDRYFHTGDLVVMDERGTIFFKDRIGDTFRWKGENVSTAEVETVMTRVLLAFGVREVAVYGVQVPGQEGRAGMAAIADPERRADLRVLADQLAAKLPVYARPVFVRVSDSLPMTGTHKVSKVLLQRQGFDAVPTEDPVFVFDARTGGYERLTDELIADIKENRLRI